MCQKPRHGTSATDEAKVPLLSRSQYVEQFQQMGQSEVPRRVEVSSFFASLAFLIFIEVFLYIS